MRAFLNYSKYLLIAALTITGIVALQTDAVALVHDCSSCHALHGTDLIPAESQIETICLNCHGAGGTSALKADVHKNKPGKGQSDPRFNFTFSCVDCHNPHEGETGGFTNWSGDTNIKLVGRADLAGGSGVTEVNEPGLGVRNIVFSELIGPGGGAYDIADLNGEYDRACETCHSNPQLGHHTNELCVPDATGDCGDHSHNITKRCSTCHNHDNFFWK